MADRSEIREDAERALSERRSLYFDPQAIIARYIAAFKATEAGQVAPTPEIKYVRGWFVFRQYHVTQRFRRVDLQDMTARLETRLAAKPTTASHSPHPLKADPSNTGTD